MSGNAKWLFGSFVLMVGLFYFPGLLLYPFLTEAFQDYYNYQGSPYQSFLVVFPIYVLMLFFWVLLFSSFRGVAIPQVSYAVCSFFIWALLVLFMVCAFYFGAFYGSSFRHVNRLYGSGMMANLVFLLKPVVCFLVLYAVLHVARGDRLGSRAKGAFFIIFLSLCFSITSSLQALAVAVVGLVLCSPKVFTWRLLRCNLKLLALSFVLLPALLFVVLVVGVGNKIGYEVFFSQQGLVYVVDRGWALLSRISSSLFSLATVFNLVLEGGFDYQYSERAIAYTISNRFNAVFLGGFNADTIETVNRYNYELVFAGLADRAGASPGPLSSMFYFPLFPMGFVLVPAIHALMASNISRVMGGRLTGGVVSMVTVPFLIVMFFEAPINVFYIFDPFFFSLMAFFLMRILPIKDFLSR
ncbi:hypothetical protein [Ectopseudomonas toyotomiensis]|uniref:Oligosaccharide repeat unit polymerase n=1 Tax=Ectopseudomonas toyotomiensis TaxID=554344 RepID=A0AA42LM85_9GAMM|nr:hypothetical protein [Pseudomonas toyotomiensis]MBG0843055.1 hypothetical protein [Pseudomonas toyotomiensis]MDH0703140.1 hypothetical protein [Pseudomonas toyotomiensis]